MCAVLGAWFTASLAGTVTLAAVEALMVWGAAVDAGLPLVRWSLSLFALPHDAVLTLVGGAPAHLLLATLGLRRWPAYGLAGIAAGAVVAALLPVSGIAGSPGWGMAASLADGAAAGAGGALAFWGVLRPDQT